MPGKNLEKRRVLEIGSIRYWYNAASKRLFPVIKTENGFRHLARHLWERHNGKIPTGFNVGFKDRNPFNHDISDLDLLSNKQLAKFNATKSSIGL